MGWTDRILVTSCDGNSSRLDTAFGKCKPVFSFGFDNCLDRSEPVPGARSVGGRVNEMEPKHAADTPSGSPEPIEAHLSAQQFRDLGLKDGETLVLTPRKARVFLEA